MTTEPTTRTATPLPPVVDEASWQAALDELRVREKAATRELDAIAAQRPAKCPGLGVHVTSDSRLLPVLEGTWVA